MFVASTVYVPGGTLSAYRPAESVTALAWTAPLAVACTDAPGTGRSGQGLLTRSTGHVGPAVTVPMICAEPVFVAWLPQAANVKMKEHVARATETLFTLDQTLARRRRF